MLISIASRLFSVGKILHPDIDLVHTAIFPEFKNSVAGSTMFDIPGEQFKLHWFVDGSMLMFINGNREPVVIEDLIQIRDYIVDGIDSKTVRQAVATIVTDLIFSETQYPAQKAQQVIVDSCSWNNIDSNIGDN